MAGQAKNIIVGAARVWVSYGTGTNRPDLTASTAFNYNVSLGTSTNTASTTSTPQFLSSTASSYWRDLGFTSTGVDVSYEPGYSDVVVDQLLDAARLFQQSLKVVIKTELDEGTFENMNFVWGQQEVYTNLGPSSSVSASTITQSGSVTQLNIAAGSLGIAPVERSMVFVGNAPGTFGTAAAYPAGSGGSATITAGNAKDVAGIRSKERVYVARRIIQEQTTAHALKRDAATVFPVSFRALPDSDRSDNTGGSEYGFIIDRVFGSV